MSQTRKSGAGNKTYQGQHRREHWYRDNQVYFITARCRERYPAFAGAQAKAIFWDRLEHHTAAHSFTLWVVSLLDNHYHILGYCKTGPELGRMMQRIHGSVAKLVNDLLPERRVPFWRESHGKDYFDGCIRNEKQCRLAYRYTMNQAVSEGIVRDSREYQHTHAYVPLDHGVKRALELGAFLEGVPYKRYEVVNGRPHSDRNTGR